MKQCDKCKVQVKTNRKTCPLCGQILIDNHPNQEIDNLYPAYEYPNPKVNIAVRILLFISIVAIALSVSINILTFVGSYWSIYVILGILYAWILMRTTILSHHNIAFRLLVQLFALSIVTYGIERVSESSGWALEYVVPFLCISTTIAIGLIMVIKPMRYADYISYLFIIILISWIPLIFYFTEIIDILWPSVAAASLSLTTILGMITFADRATKDELKKRFHI